MTESTNVIQVLCPNCNAQPGQPCTVPGVGARSNGRRPVAWVHHSREDVALEADMEARRAADSDRLNRSTNVADDDVWHDSRGVVWSSASAALQDFIDDLPSMDDDQQENVFQFTRHDAPAAFNLAAIAHGIDYAGLSDLFESYPVPKPGNYVVPSVNKPRYIAHALTSGDYSHILGRDTHQILDDADGIVIAYADKNYAGVIIAALNERGQK